eukprot:Trichotokara_eunicae@DN5717_c0_g2_i1.p1
MVYRSLSNESWNKTIQFRDADRHVAKLIVVTAITPPGEFDDWEFGKAKAFTNVARPDRDCFFQAYPRAEEVGPYLKGEGMKLAVIAHDDSVKEIWIDVLERMGLDETQGIVFSAPLTSEEGLFNAMVQATKWAIDYTDTELPYLPSAASPQKLSIV